MKNKMILKITIAIVVIAVIAIIIYFFSRNVNKNSKMGNNLSNKTNQEIEEYILNISSYEAEIDVEVETNKNKTKYKIKQSYVAPNIEKQTILEPSIYLLGSCLYLSNTVLSLYIHFSYDIIK